MNRWFIPAFSLLALSACAAMPKDPVDLGGPPVPDGAKWEKIAGGFHFTEGPAADAEGNVYFSDQGTTVEQVPRIYFWDAATNKVSVFMDGDTGRSNGMCFDYTGHLITCADEKDEMWSIDTRTRQHTVLFDSYEGKRLNARSA